MKEMPQVLCSWEWLTTGRHRCIQSSRTPSTRVTQPLAKEEAPTFPSLENEMWWHRLSPSRSQHHWRALRCLWQLWQSCYELSHHSQTPDLLMSSSMPTRRSIKCEPALDRSMPRVGLHNGEASSPASEQPSKPSWSNYTTASLRLRQSDA
jgi:hypothetical protein